jgi:hypothetical protein
MNGLELYKNNNWNVYTTSIPNLDYYIDDHVFTEDVQFDRIGDLTLTNFITVVQLQ